MLLGELYDNKAWSEPASTGPMAAPAYCVTVVNPGTQYPTGATQAQAARDVADRMGWDLPAYDGTYELYDDLMTAGGSGAVMGSSRNDALEVVSGSGRAANVNAVHKNGGRTPAGPTTAAARHGPPATWSSVSWRTQWPDEVAAASASASVFVRDHNLSEPGRAWTTSTTSRCSRRWRACPNRKAAYTALTMLVTASTSA